MSTIVLLSSSPPRVFARSPTPADSSSPLPSTAALLQDRSPGNRRFKTKTDRCDGPSPAFCTARQILAKKSGAENAIIPTLGRNKFRSSQDDAVEEVIEITGALKQSKPRVLSRINKEHPSDLLQSGSQSKLEGVASVVQLGDENGESQWTSEETLLLERATARKLDWTPPCVRSKTKGEEKPVEYSAGFLGGMLSNYAYSDSNRVLSAPQIQGPNPAKRRRVEHVRDVILINSEDSISVPELAKPHPSPAKSVPKNNRSPVKKPLTITGLATSNYLGQDEADESPMMQYLVSTQAQLNDVSTGVGLQTKVQKTKAAAQKLKGSKKKQAASLLLSPQSAMKAYDSQETVFGSASQLEREESPAFLREIIEATKESESFMLSDPVSPQRTQPLSVENTPRLGTARYRKTRNLWAAAGRDDDNALLHVDTVDLTDTPAVRAAFAGKDVMLQPSMRQMSGSTKPGPSFRGGYSLLTPNCAAEIVDIGDISTGVSTTRKFSSTTSTESPRKSPARVRGPATKSSTSHEVLDITKVKEQPPPKPNYEGFSIHDLNKQIKSYGFKAMRKREKMIELLNRCWEEKYGPSKGLSSEKTPKAPYGDFLSTVHDLSARPEPKTKKTPVRKKKSESANDANENPAKKPRQRKRKDSQEQETNKATVKQKAPRKRKTKSALASKGSVIDIDSVWVEVPEELRSLETFDDWAKPERKPKSMSKLPHEPVLSTVETPQRPATPPATLPLEEIPAASLIAGDILAAPQGNIQPAEYLSTPAATPSMLPIGSQITAAIMHQSKSIHPGRNHNVNPTWHQKLLLYDPIILEDLAAWLNTEGLGAIGEDREVSALEVREWCEARGICCLWRGGWRGNKLAQ